VTQHICRAFLVPELAPVEFQAVLRHEGRLDRLVYALYHHVVHAWNNGTGLGRGDRGNNFFKTLAKLVSSSVFSLAKAENNWPKIKKG
jgi:hypothetical protein